MLNATIIKHLSQYAEANKEFILKLLHSLYVDDFDSGRNRGIESKEHNIAKIVLSEIDSGQIVEEDESFSRSLFDPHAQKIK